jgi:hypothetical protein
MKLILRSHHTFAPGPVVPPGPTDANPKRSGSWKAFLRRFNPIDNPIAPECWQIDPDDMVSCPPEHIWTVIDGDGCDMQLVAGWHRANRIGYVVARNPRVDAGDTPYKPYTF